jgi:hypothetical protein
MTCVVILEGRTASLPACHPGFKSAQQSGHGAGPMPMGGGFEDRFGSRARLGTARRRGWSAGSEFCGRRSSERFGSHRLQSDSERAGVHRPSALAARSLYDTMIACLPRFAANPTKCPPRRPRDGTPVNCPARRRGRRSRAPWARTCRDGQTRLVQRSLRDDDHRFPGPCL